VEISPCYNSWGNTGVDKRVFLSDQYATVRCANGPSGQLLITQRTDGARVARKHFFGSTKTHFDPGKTLNVYMGLIMINPQKPMINLIKNVNRFTALIFLNCFFTGYHVSFEIFDSRTPGCPPEFMNIPVPKADPYFDPSATGKVLLPFQRGPWDKESGQSPSNPRTQVFILIK